MQNTAVIKNILPNKMNIKSGLRTFTMVFALIAIWLIFNFVTDGAFLQSRNLSNLFRQMSITGFLATGMVLVIVAGHIDLSVGSTVCFVGAILAILTTKYELSPLVSVLITLIFGIVVGSINGYLVSYQKIPAFIVTLGGMMAFRGASMWITSANTIPLNDGWLKDLGTGYIPSNMGWGITSVAVVITSYLIFRARSSRIKYGLPVNKIIFTLLQVFTICGLIIAFMAVMANYEGIPIPVLIMFALMIIFHFIAQNTTFGRHVYAIGGNPDAAFLSGIPVKLRTLGVFALIGVLSTVAGIILTARVGSASPDAGQMLELDAVAACVIGGTSLMGGRGSVFGAILGALVIESLNNGMSMANMESFWQYIVKGCVLVVAVWVDRISSK